jgi:hypothetical protein
MGEMMKVETDEKKRAEIKRIGEEGDCDGLCGKKKTDFAMFKIGEHLFCEHCTNVLVSLKCHQIVKLEDTVRNFKLALQEIKLAYRKHINPLETFRS